jgi:hypothetical protein
LAALALLIRGALRLGDMRRRFLLDALGRFPPAHEIAKAIAGVGKALSRYC